jgi:hypothetical protein
MAAGRKGVSLAASRHKAAIMVTDLFNRQQGRWLADLCNRDNNGGRQSCMLVEIIAADRTEEQRGMMGGRQNCKTTWKLAVRIK